MNIKKTIIYALFVGILTFVLILTTYILETLGFITNKSLLTFISFAGWWSYFLLSPKIKNVARGWVCIIIGLAVGIGVFILADYIGSLLHNNIDYIAIAFSSALGSTLIILFGKLPHINLISFMFIGETILFAAMGNPGVSSAPKIVILLGFSFLLLLGMFVGWLSVFVGQKIEKFGVCKLKSNEL
jgi:hypothetical protein